MRGLFERLFAPSEEPSQDPYLYARATVEALKRSLRYQQERDELMAAVRERAAKSALPKGVVRLAEWKEHSA